MTNEEPRMDQLEVRDAMTHLVVTLHPGDKIPYAAQRLLSNRISGAPVLEDGRVVGVVSEADFLRACTPQGTKGPHFVALYPLMFLLRGSRPPVAADAKTVRDVMTTGVVSIGPHAGILEAASLIDRHGVRRLPVIDDEGYLVGILARSDLVRCMAGVVGARAATGDDDRPHRDGDGLEVRSLSA